MTQSQTDIAALVAELRRMTKLYREYFGGDAKSAAVWEQAADALEAKAAPEVMTYGTVETLRIAKVFRWLVSNGAPDDVKEAFSALTAALQPEGK